MSLRFVVLAHDDLPMLERLVRSLAPYRVYLHVDRPAVPQLLGRESTLAADPRVTTNPQPRCLHWGGYSILEAMVDTMALALDGAEADDHLVVLSGHCYPLRPVAELDAHLSSSERPVLCRAFDLTSAPPPFFGMMRVTERHWLDGPIGHLKKVRPRVRGVRRVARALSRPFPLRPPALHHACGSQWVALPSELAVEIVLRHRRGQFAYLRNAYAPDEMAIQTYVHNTRWAALTPAGGLEAVSGLSLAPLANLHWLRPNLQGLLTSEDVDQALDSDRWFVRKVSIEGAKQIDQARLRSG